MLSHDKLLRKLQALMGPNSLLRGEAAMAYEVDWTNSFQGNALAVALPSTVEEVAKVLSFCSHEGVAVVPQGGNTGLVGGGIPLNGELVLSTRRLTTIKHLDLSTGQVTVGAGVPLEALNQLTPQYQFGLKLASQDSATVGGAIATNAGGVRVLRYGSMRAQVAGVEAVLSNGAIISHLNGLTKDNTGYHYPSLLAGSEGTLAVVTSARIQLVEKIKSSMVVLVGLQSLEEAHSLALSCKQVLPTLLSAEFFIDEGLTLLHHYTSLALPLEARHKVYLLLELEATTDEVGPLEELISDYPSAVGITSPEKARLWTYRERQPEAVGFIAPPLKLDVAVPHANWCQLTSLLPSTIAEVDPQATLNLFGHIADGNVHVNIAPAAPRDGRHEEAVFSLVASLGGSIAAEHGIGALKTPWLHLNRSPEELSLFKSIRRAFDPTATLNPSILPLIS